MLTLICLKRSCFFVVCGPKMFIIYYEITNCNSIHIFQNTSFNCCNFLFNQIFVRFMNKNGIIDDYINDLNFKKYVKYLLLLIYVPVDKINYEFETILKLKQKNSSYDLITDFL
ncbi:hypothetical protein DMUE_4983 [Dictyocoela muelleri]|nr:hypothetical protein DMUE_4983 [Dictyocoela muelleri]